MNRNEFVISVNGLAQGETTLLGRVDKEFFAKFENEEILDADLDVTLFVDKRPGYVDVDCDLDGTIAVPCDRCLSPVQVEVSTSASFRLRLKDQSIALEEDQEEVFLTEGSDTLDLSQEIYDFALLALPLQRFHNEGECDKTALDYLSKGDMPVQNEDGPVDSPFSNLAEMLSKKN